MEGGDALFGGSEGCGYAGGVGAAEDVVAVECGFEGDGFVEVFVGLESDLETADL